ncbi:MAG TPA: hypothetical protein VFT91_00225, partial [Dehalococcoidia bacterium]|nr:hypothetical protein [Dehalococcoidia bacterium]
LSQVLGGGHHRHADGLNAVLVEGLNRVLDRRDVPGCAYGLASYFHVVLGREAARPQDGIEWPWPDREPPPRMPWALVQGLKRGMINHGVDLMSGSGGFVSGVHAREDIDQTVEAFEAAITDMQAEGLL